MSTTGSASEGGRKYKPLPPPRQQTRIGARRSIAKRTPSIPTLNKKQSSLTQMDFVSTPRAPVDISSDDDDEYEERPAKRPKILAENGKKNKFSKREAGQSSFTQVDYMRRMRQPRRFDVGEDGFQIWHDSDTEVDVVDSSPALNARPSALASTIKDEQSENDAPEIAESSQNLSNDDKQGDIHGGRTASRASPLRTPQKVRFVEVLSSQTTRNPKSSTQRTYRRYPNANQSPLKERSANTQSSLKDLPNPESQHATMKMLERARFANQQRARKAKAQSENNIDADLERCAAEATDEFSLRTCTMPPPPRILQRKTTVQDSQVDDFDPPIANTQDGTCPKLARTNTIGDSQRNSSNETIAEGSQMQRPARRLRRVATVQDSQAEDSDFDFDFDDISGTPERPNTDDTLHEGPADGGQRTQYFAEGTYDPAFSALDRDASRFRWTQTQAMLSAPGDDSEMEEEDLDRGCTTSFSSGNGSKLDSAPREDLEPSAPPSVPAARTEGNDDPKEHNPSGVGPSLADAVVRDDSAYESGDQVSATQGIQVPSSPPQLGPLSVACGPPGNTAETQVPSSPPPLRPSQVSTVVPTQMSLPPRLPSPRKPIKPEPLSQMPTPRQQRKSQPFNLLSSPQKSNSFWQPESLSSSPLPLPPWSSPEKHRFVHPSREGESILAFGNDMQMDSLADFSLPPPPPLSSSRRQTPASSSL